MVELGYDLQFALAQGFYALVGEVLAIHPPLRLHERLDDILGPRAKTQLHGVRLLLHPKVFLLEGILYCLTGLIPVLTLELAAELVDVALLVEDGDHLQLVALAALEIVEVVRRGDLDTASAKFTINHGIRNHYHLSVGVERMDQLLADELGVPVVLRVHADGGIAEHGLKTCRGHGEELVRALDLVFELAQHAHFHLLIKAGDLEVGDAGDFLVVYL
mmetsp:Transcript_74093/g.154526  ORF Transcript_74093/g.154526 Transcript_74093/m.154526 type:complete len:218 (+) Transcript_74093:1694-2347(+)